MYSDTLYEILSFTNNTSCARVSKAWHLAYRRANRFRLKINTDDPTNAVSIFTKLNTMLDTDTPWQTITIKLGYMYEWYFDRCVFNLPIAQRIGWRQSIKSLVLYNVCLTIDTLAQVLSQTSVCFLTLNEVRIDRNSSYRYTPVLKSLTFTDYGLSTLALFNLSAVGSVDICQYHRDEYVLNTVIKQQSLVGNHGVKTIRLLCLESTADTIAIQQLGCDFEIEHMYVRNLNITKKTMFLRPQHKVKIKSITIGCLYSSGVDEETIGKFFEYLNTFCVERIYVMVAAGYLKKQLKKRAVVKCYKNIPSYVGKWMLSNVLCLV